MVNSDKLDSTFKQSYNSCVIASYAIVANYYTGISMKNFFEDSCKTNNIYSKSQVEEFRIKYNCPEDDNVYECIYAKHFDSQWKKSKRLGLEIIKDLHNNSKEMSFAKSRSKFRVEFFRDVGKEKELIEKTLKDCDALLIAATKTLNGASHIKTFGYD